MVSQGQAAQSETKVSAASRVRASGSGQAFRGMFNRSKSELSIVQTMQLLKSRGLNVALDSSQLPAWYMIDSRTSKHISKWDFTLVIALVVVALLTPFEVAFLPPAQAIDWLFWVNRVLDLVFTMDMVVICFRIVAVTSHVEGMRWIVKPKELFARYYKSGWFFVDLFTLIVSLMDVVTPLLNPEDASVIRKFKVCAPHPHPPAQPPPPQLDYMHAKLRVLPPRQAAPAPLSARTAPTPPTSAQVLRVLRAVRLARLAKLLSASRVLQELETQLLIGYGTIMLIKVAVQMVVYCHWFACLWALQTQLSETSLTKPSPRRLP